jgi:hypothetical protein
MSHAGKADKVLRLEQHQAQEPGFFGNMEGSSVLTQLKEEG